MTTALARRFRAQLSNTGLDGSWIDFKGLNDLNVPVVPNKQSDADYDTDGWDSFGITMQAWTATLKALRKTNAGVFDTAQEMARARRGKFGDDSMIYFRYFDRNGAPEAYRGRAIVEYNQSKTGVADWDEVTVTLTGSGALVPIANPGVAAVAPVIISAVTQDGTNPGTGSLLKLTGSGFAGITAAAAVKVGASNATGYNVVSDSVIILVTPSGSAGDTTASVTNSVGVSNLLPITRQA